MKLDRETLFNQIKDLEYNIRDLAGIYQNEIPELSVELYSDWKDALSELRYELNMIEINFDRYFNVYIDERDIIT